MSGRLVIAGARYYSPEDKAILIPHFTGEWVEVGCDSYLTEEDALGIYGDEVNEVEDDFISHKGVNYFDVGYAVFKPTEKWELLSNLWNLRYDGDED